MTYTPLQPVARSKVPRYREIAYQAIKEAILIGHLEPDQPLIEEQLANSLQISRTPIREALAILEHEGLIGPGAGRGVYVRKLTRSEFLEMFVANEAVEPYLARRAARLATDAQLKKIEEAIERGWQSIAKTDIAEFLGSGRDFHRFIGVASGNTTLTKFVVSNEERTDLFLLSSHKDIDTSKMEDSIQEHEAIFRAIARHDPEAASRLVIYHAQSLRERFAGLFNDQFKEDDP